MNYSEYNSTKKNILVQVNNTFEYYWCSAIVIENINKFDFDLLVPIYWQNQNIINNCKYLFKNIYYFNPKIRNLLSPYSLYNTFKLISWAKKSKYKYHFIIFGAFRHDITNILANVYKCNSKLIAIKQGIDLPESQFCNVYSFANIHNLIYYYLFGYSNLKLKKIKQNIISYDSCKYMYDRLFWSINPINYTYTIGTKPFCDDIDSSNERFILPDLRKLFNQNSGNIKRGILIIGERTPMTPLWTDSNTLELVDIINEIVKFFNGEKIYLRERKKLTDSSFYDFLDYISLDSNEDFEGQLIKLNPLLVISVKSSACKTSSYLGYDSVVLYPSLTLNKLELNVLDYFFDDCSLLLKVKSFSQFVKSFPIDRNNNYNLKYRLNLAEL